MGRISLVSPSSFRPPIHRSGVVNLASAPTPSWVLLDVRGYILKRRNSTTASCKFRGDKEIQVTFFPAHPPHVSYFSVYCSNTKSSDYGLEPKIIATEGNLVLFRVAFGLLHEIYGASAHEYFMYTADNGDGRPLLENIPRPPHPIFIHDQQIGLLSNGNGGYTIAALIDDSLSASNDQSFLYKYDICIFSSEHKVWTIRTANLMLQQEHEFRHYTSKVITIGGKCGIMGFVDLWQGILLYDVLGNNPLLRYTVLPVIDSEIDGDYSDYALFYRDVAYVNGHIKFVEMPDRIRATDSNKAATWSLPAATALSQQNFSWICHSIEFSKIRDEQKLLPSEFMKMLTVQTGERLPTMESLHVGHPTLSLHDDHIVYFMTKVKPLDMEACVVAVDMSSGTIQGAARFDAQRTRGLDFTFRHSRISNFFKTSPGRKDEASSSKQAENKNRDEVFNFEVPQPHS